MMILAYVSLFVASIGIGGIYTAAIGMSAPRFIGSLIGTVPWAMVFMLTFAKAPAPIEPRRRRQLVAFALAWYVASVAGAEVLVLLGLAPVNPKAPHAILAFRVLMHAGWASFFPLVRWYRASGPGSAFGDGNGA